MNPTSPSDRDMNSDDRIVDALLCESARLGSHSSDDDLVRTILTETVAKTPPQDLQRTSHPADLRLWVTGSIAAAALIALLATLLAVVPFRGDRNSEEIFLVVQYGNPPSEEVQSTLRESPAPFVQPRRYDGIVDLISAPSVTFPHFDFPEEDWDLPPVFSQSIEKFEARPPRHERFRIVADHTSEVGGERIYTGNVELSFHGFAIKAETVRILVKSQSSQGAVGTFLATGVSLTQASPSRSAAAGKAEFDPVSGALLLTEVTSFETSGTEFTNLAAEDRLILTDDGFAIQNGVEAVDNSTKYANPLPITQK